MNNQEKLNEITIGINWLIGTIQKNPYGFMKNPNM